jgi:membrane protein
MTATRSPRTREFSSLTDLGFLRHVASRIGELRLMAFAAALAFGAVFALVPMLVLLVLLLGLFQAEGLVNSAMVELQDVLPADALSLVQTQLTNVATTNEPGTFGLGVLVSALVALWGAGGAMRRMMDALNVVHQVDEPRPFIRKVLVSSVLALGAIATIVVTIAIVVVGGDIASTVFDVLGLGAAAEVTWAWIRWPLLVVVAWLAIAMAYRFAPASRRCGGFLTPGTLLATVGWVGFSLLFSWYVGNIGNFDATWGAVAGVIVLLLYLQYTALIVLVGALVDVQLWDRARPASRWRRMLRSGDAR